MNADEQTTLSIVMPVYNAENTLLRAVRSFDRLADFQRNIELIVVDDASLDKSRALLDQLALERSYMRVIGSKQNCGPGAARSKGIKASNSRFIGFLDADDELLAENYSNALEECLAAKHDLVTFDSLVDYGSGYQSRYDKDRLTSDRQKLLKLCLRGQLDGCVMFSIFSRQMLGEANIKFGKYYFEDIEFNYKALLSANNMLVSNAVCYKKYNTEGSILNRCSALHINGLIGSALSVRDFVSLNFELDKSEIDRDFRYCLADYVCCLLDGICNQEDVGEREFLRQLLTEKIQSCGILETEPFELTAKGKKANSFLLGGT